ncbi:MAG: NifB/NifX family molybdenum-iron cluster-binding protein [Bacteroidales bacterium]|jgi:predicted Fe-Mo cluster-binding NifX family protein|nr:NifB/NifX family molybdenum-iron cluster-binding protein [Bacteroidales bacterium]
MKRRIAVPMEHGALCSHFGHCEYFCFVDVEDGKISGKKEIVPPEHEPGLYPRWVKEQGAGEVICGGIGMKARNLFAAENIKLYIGVANKSAEELVEDLLGGVLRTGENSCDH